MLRKSVKKRMVAVSLSILARSSTGSLLTMSEVMTDLATLPLEKPACSAVITGTVSVELELMGSPCCCAIDAEIIEMDSAHTAVTVITVLMKASPFQKLYTAINWL